jgi:hypothetical protein
MSCLYTDWNPDPQCGIQLERTVRHYVRCAQTTDTLRRNRLERVVRAALLGRNKQ